MSIYRRGGKRLFDLTAASVGFVLLMPVMAVVAVVVRVKLGSQVLFRQTRPGLGGEPFRIVKFRTMTDETGPDGRLLPDEERLGRLGVILRSTSLDELPELWNVIRGDMSLVGPRPLLVAYLDRYTAEQARRHDVRPGITGWSQVNGRNNMTWPAKLALDTWYVDNYSFGLDLKTLWRTVSAVLRRSGVSAEGHATTHEFKGAEG